MLLPEGYLPREGDVLIVHATVKYNVDPGEENVHINVAGIAYRDAVIPLDKIVGLYCRAWAPEDKVRNINDHEDCGEVLAVCDDKVWVKLRSGAMATFEANALEPQPDSTPHLIVAAPPSDFDPI